MLGGLKAPARGKWVDTALLVSIILNGVLALGVIWEGIAILQLAGTVGR